MGYGEFGGGGSVKWALDVDDTSSAGKKRVNANGRDDQKPATFTVTIEYNDAAKGNTAWEYVKNAVESLGPNAKKLVFQIPFDDDEKYKVKVQWP